MNSTQKLSMYTLKIISHKIFKYETVFDPDPIWQIWVPKRVPIYKELIFFFTDTGTSYMNYAERAFATQQDGWFKLGGDFTPPSKRRQLFSILLSTIFNGRINLKIL